MKASTHLMLIVYFVNGLNAEEKWSYHDVDSWPGICQTGKRQSPVDIGSTQVTRTVYGRETFKFKGYDEPLKVETIINDGHTVLFSLESSDTIWYPTITGGGLLGEYKLVQFHFHWGSEDLQGSEHAINGFRTPMEMHLVHYKSSYGTDFKSALANNNNTWDTLAVLGVMFRIQEEDNPNLENIVEELQFVKYLNQQIQNVTVFPLEKLMPSNTNVFTQYLGSLTAPPCYEVTIWTIFEEPIGISENQLNQFRDLLAVLEDTFTFESEFENFQPIEKINPESENFQPIQTNDPEFENFRTMQPNNIELEFGNFRPIQQTNADSENFNVMQPNNPETYSENFRPMQLNNPESENFRPIQLNNPESENFRPMQLNNPESESDNFRPMQPLNDRELLLVFADSTCCVPNFLLIFANIFTMIVIGLGLNN